MSSATPRTQRSDPSQGSGEDRIRRALWWSFAVFGAVGAAVAALILLRDAPAVQELDAERKIAGPSHSVDVAGMVPPLPFTDITAAAGIDFFHENGAYGERLLPETMGGGVAFLDYDNDGHQDLLFVNSRQWPWREDARQATSRLYRNRGDGTFEDVSSATGMALHLYGMGVAVGDYDGDGFVDVFVTAVGTNRLLRNMAGERFVDVTAEAHVAGAEDAWSTSAAFFDYDGDHDLDLFVCNYVAWSPAIDRAVDFRLTGIGRAYGPPTDFPGTHSYLYRNDDGTFVDVSVTAGIQVAHPATGLAMGKALAVRPLDVNDDGWLDLAIANDTVRNFLFVNQQDGTFEETGIDAGLAFDPTGSATGAMGIDAARYANDNALAIAIGNFANEMTSFYVARPGEQVFSDDAIVAGIGAPSRRGLTFGLAFLDVDLDGRPDVVAANGHVEPEIGRVQASQSYAQPAQLFWNCGAFCPRRYALADETGALAVPMVGRGAAYADVDGDGDLDLAITQAGGPARLLRNDQTRGNAWVRFQLIGEPPNRHAIGATLTLTSGGTTQTRVVMPTRSYLSQIELPTTFGVGDIGQGEHIDAVAVRWPDGTTQQWVDLRVQRSYLLEKKRVEVRSIEPRSD